MLDNSKEKVERSVRPEGRTHLGKTRFLIDGMLGSLAIKLRILGFDTLYDKVSHDSELLCVARESKRCLVTSDRELFLQARRTHINCVEITARDEEGRLVELFSKLGWKFVVTPVVSRCSACNGTLSETKSKNRDGRDVYECDDCHKRYWKGSHWKKLEELFVKVNSKLRNSKTNRGKR